MSNSKKWFIIINPTSGNGKAKTLWPKIENQLNHERFQYVFHFTSSGLHNVELIHNAVNQGFNKIICIGGDGTIHNTVNGIMLQTISPTSSINVGVIPIGTGNDWVKTYNIPKDYKKAIDTIKNGTISQQDIGKIEFLDSQKEAVFFNNLAGVGFDGYVVSKVGKYKHFGALAYLIGAISGLFSFKNFDVEVVANSQKIKTKSLMVLIGLCKYSGGGMQLTEYTNPTDGLFDISIAKNFSKLDILKNLVKLFNGSIVKLKKVETFKTNTISVNCKNKLNIPFVQADGELIGTGGIKVQIIPKAFSFYTK
ncbi:diacylglycerol/lipid kinase family protein [Pontimicrobium aquaticum]|uniref:Diacylglycerol kinase family lipid kinase n=1 Tax=Pontimicrobium aquaticum TaxID=2565367 RepID=A0A4U0ESM3_9FLAO|nr:diacylglycerol kinase family protein [Pontimicrobium aquaticum]TJY34785.1 diacylglycerol kinase family lipid kinase [Pontimicrobium aquaticum]